MEEREKIAGFLRQLLEGNIFVPKEIKEIQSDEDELAAYALELGKQVVDGYNFIQEISVGNLAAEAPIQTNYIAGSGKNLQSTLKQLIWQLECVANNDFNQRMDYLGDFTKGFELFKSQVILREQYKNETFKREKENLEQMNHMLNQQLTQQLAYYDRLREMNQEVISIKHDMKNHCLALSALVEKKEFEETKVYLQSLMSGISAIKRDVINTGNPICDALLTDKISKAKEKGIDVETTLGIREGLNIDNKDWCIILGNAMDNAIEACEFVEAGKKYIEIRMQSRKNILNIAIKNSARQPKENEGGLYKTSKENTYEHGYGLKNIEKAVERYDGVLAVNYASGAFILNAMLCNV